jgi:hypothetical protein
MAVVWKFNNMVISKTREFACAGRCASFDMAVLNTNLHR